MHKFIVTSYKMYDLGDSETNTLLSTNDPRAALESWCKEQKGNPSGISIEAHSSEDVRELLKYAQDNIDWLLGVITISEKFPYKTSYVVEGINKSLAKDNLFASIDKRNANIKGEYDYIAWDMIHPFCFG